MSTPGCIGIATSDGWIARFHEFDSYPTGLGASLWKHLHTHFKGDLDAMLKVLIEEHPAGWMSILDKNFALAPGYHSGWWNLPLIQQCPQCRCHGELDCEHTLFTQDDPHCIDIYWAYIFDKQARTLTVYGMTYPEADTGNWEIWAWKNYGTFALDGEEPDWQQLEDMDDEEGE